MLTLLTVVNGENFIGIIYGELLTVNLYRLESSHDFIQLDSARSFRLASFSPIIQVAFLRSLVWKASNQTLMKDWSFYNIEWSLDYNDTTYSRM